MIHYIIQIIAYQFLFLLVYDLFLKRETFYTWNRIYLLSTLVFSFFIPFLRIDAIQQSIPETYYVQLPTLVIEGSAPENVSVITSILIWLQANMTTVWMVGVVVMLALLTYKLHRVMRLKRHGETDATGPFSVITLPGTNTAFTFFKWVFLGENLSEEQKQHILKHEEVHVRLKHSLDLMFFEIVRVLFWFNPLVYLYQKRMALLQEFTADAYVASQESKKAYYRQLLAQVFDTNTISFVNTFFNHSLIKKRIIMLQKSRSKKIFGMKYLLLIPVVGIMLIYVACTQEQPRSENLSVEDRFAELKVAIANGELTADEKREFSELYLQINGEKIHAEKQLGSNVGEDAVAFKQLSYPPIYPGCEGLSASEAQTCFSQKLQQFVMKNFDTSIAKDMGLEGRQRITVKFRIDANGVLSDVETRAPHPALEKAAYMAVRELPDMIPGQKDGKAVAVLYALPIVFAIQ